MDVAIVGAGFAGMSAALFLARAGHRVTLYERAAEPGPVGAAIVLQPSGLAVLRALGVDARVEARSARLDRLHVTTAKGRTIVDLRYATIDPAWYGLGVARGVLFEALWDALAPAGVRMLAGREVDSLVPIADRHELAFTDGARAGPHELVIAADGARSRTAAGIRGRSVHPYRWGALFHVGAFPDTAELNQVGDGARRFMGVLPMGAGRASLFWSLRADRLDAWRAGFAAWREEAMRLDPRAASIIEGIGAPEQVLFAPYFDVRMKRPYADRGPPLVAIGDAAHATSPQLGQGSNLALIDALALAACLGEHADPAAALRAYHARRRRHLAYYQRATRWLTPLFQSDSRVLGWLRDLFMPLAMRLPPTRRLMTSSMAGVAAGFFGRREPLPAPWP